jgi:hypothetical protein
MCLTRNAKPWVTCFFVVLVSELLPRCLLTNDPWTARGSASDAPPFCVPEGSVG